VPGDTEGVEVGQTEEGRWPWHRRLSIPVQAVRGEDAVSGEPVAVDVVVAVSHGTHQQLTKRRVHKHADFGGHDLKGMYSNKGGLSVDHRCTRGRTVRRCDDAQPYHVRIAHGARHSHFKKERKNSG
jgi:hypothetical protein